MQYAMMVVIAVQPIQVPQCVTVFDVRWREPRRMRRKMYLAVICSIVSIEFQHFRTSELTHVKI